MENQWNLLKDVKETSHNDIEALANVPADSSWFSGHFPGEPILPGIALVHLVKQVIARGRQKKREKLQFYALRRIRFTQPVRPGDSLSVNINAEDAGEEILFHFKVVCKGNIVSSGMIAARK